MFASLLPRLQMCKAILNILSCKSILSPFNIFLFCSHWPFSKSAVGCLFFTLTYNQGRKRYNCRRRMWHHTAIHDGYECHRAFIQIPSKPIIFDQEVHAYAKVMPRSCQGDSTHALISDHGRIIVRKFPNEHWKNLLRSRPDHKMQIHWCKVLTR